MDAECQEVCGEKAPMEKRVYRPGFFWVWLTWVSITYFSQFTSLLLVNFFIGKTFAENPGDALPVVWWAAFISGTTIALLMFLLAHKSVWLELDGDCLVVPSKKKWRFGWAYDSRRIPLSDIEFSLSRFRHILNSTLTLHSGEKIKFSLFILYFGPSQVADLLARISERTEVAVNSD